MTQFTLADFLATVLPPNPSCLFAINAPLKKKDPTKLDMTGGGTPITSFAEVPKYFSNTGETFFTPAEFAAGSTRRVQTSVTRLQCLWLDIDPPKRVKMTEQELRQSIKGIGLPPTAIVFSGRGFHLYYRLPEVLLPGEWLEYAHGLKAYMQTCHPALSEDTSRWTDTASWLRVPGSAHLRGGQVARIELLSPNVVLTATHLNMLHDMRVASATPPKPKTPASAVHIEGPNYVTLLEECKLLRSMAQQPETVPEPAWYAAIGVMTGVREGVDAAIEFSRGHPGFDEDEVRQKYEQWASKVEGVSLCAPLRDKAGPFTAACDGCARFKEGVSPIAKCPRMRRQTPPALALGVALNNVHPAPHEAVLPTYVVQGGTGFGTPVQPTTTDTTPAPPPPVETFATDLDRAIHELTTLCDATVTTVKGRLSLSVEADGEAITVAVGAIPVVTDIVHTYDLADRVAVSIRLWFVNREYPNVPNGGFIIPLEKLYDSGIKALSKCRTMLGSNAPLKVSNATRDRMLVDTITTYAHMLQADKTRVTRIYSRYGWVEDPAPDKPLPAFVSPLGIIVDRDTLKPSPANQSGRSHVEAAAVAKTAGSRYARADMALTLAEAQQWVALAKTWGQTPQGVLPLAASLASAMIALSPGSEPTSLVLYGAISTFKTTPMRVASSIWGPPDIMLSANGGSAPSSREKVTTRHTVPVFVDDFGTASNRSGGSETYVVETLRTHNTGITADRMVWRDNNYEAATPGFWRNYLIVSTNTDIPEMVRRSQDNSAEALTRRLLAFEYTKPEPELAAELLVAARRIPEMTDFAGSFGILFVSLLQKHPEDVAECLKLARESWGAASQHDDRFLSVMELPRITAYTIYAAALFCNLHTPLVINLEMLGDRLNSALNATARAASGVKMTDVDHATLLVRDLHAKLVRLYGNIEADVEFNAVGDPVIRATSATPPRIPPPRGGTVGNREWRVVVQKHYPSDGNGQRSTITHLWFTWESLNPLFSASGKRDKLVGSREDYHNLHAYLSAALERNGVKSSMLLGEDSLIATAEAITKGNGAPNLLMDGKDMWPRITSVGKPDTWVCFPLGDTLQAILVDDGSAAK